MSVVHDIVTKKCANCRKEISVLHPDSWAYKRHAGNTYIFWCSWKCLRQSEKEGKINMKKLTLEDKKHAVKIALDGGNPLEYIRMCGVLNAAEAWGKIKNNLKEKDPATWERLPKRLPNPVMDRKKEAPADQVTKEAMKHPEQPVVQIDGPVIMEKMAEQVKGNDFIEMPTAEEIIPKEIKKHMKPGVFEKQKNKFSLPAICQGFEVVGIRGQYGIYKANDKAKYFDFQPFGGELCMTPEEWHEQLNELQRAAKVLGVEM